MKHTISVFATCIATAALVCGCSGNRDGIPDDAPVLKIYTWSDYISPSVVERFEKANGVRVAIDIFESNESMYERLRCGYASYDVIVPSSYMIATMAREGMIERLDHSKLPNVRQNFDPSFAAQILDPSFSYSVPYAVTYTGLAFAKDKVPEGADVESWAILGNEALKGRITLLDDMREVIGAGLMYLGYSINSTRPDEIAAAVEQLIKWRGNVGKFDVENYKDEIADGGIWLCQGYSTDIHQLKDGNVGFALPDEGFAIAFDEMVIGSDSTQKDLAYKFINYLYEGDVAAENMKYLCGPMPVAPGFELLDADFRNQLIFDADILRQGQVIKSFDGRPDVQALYSIAWERIKAASAR